METKPYFDLQPKGARGADEGSYKVIVDGNNTPYKVINFDNEKVCRRSGVIILEALKRSKRNTNNLILKAYRDSVTGIIYGIPTGVNPETKRLEFQRISIEDNEVFDLSIPDQAMKWAIIKNSPFIMGSPNLGSNKPIFKVVDADRDAENFLAKLVVKRKASTIAEGLAGETLFETARNLGIPTKGRSIPVVHVDVIKLAESNADKFMEVWDSPNKLEISVLKKALAVALVTEDRQRGFVYNGIQLGFTEQEAVIYLKEHISVRQSIDLQAKKIDEDTKRSMEGKSNVNSNSANDDLAERLRQLEAENARLRSEKESSNSGDEEDEELNELRAEAKQLGVKGAHFSKDKEKLRQSIADKKQELNK